MFRRSFCLLICFLIIHLTGCAINKNVILLSAEETAPKLYYRLNTNNISLAVLDNRPYVVDEDKTPSFEGIIRSTYGIPYTFNTSNNQPMSSYLRDRLSIGFRNNGTKVIIYKTDPKMTIKKVISAISKHGNKSFILVLNEWKYDFHGFTDSSVYDVVVYVTDKLENKLISKNFSGVDDIPNSGIIPDSMQKIYKQRFENIFYDAEVMEALQR